MGRLVSVIVPVYNVEPYLNKCIESLICQTYKDIEIILINDGSADNCPAICDDYAANYERIRVIHKTNGGLSSARNTGMKAAKGEYLAFVDSDDWVEPDFIIKLAALISHDIDIAQCGIAQGDGGGVPSCTSPRPHCAILNRDELLDNLYGEINTEFTVTWNKLYKRKLFDGIEFPESRLHEDAYTTYKLFHKCSGAALIKEKLYHYTVREGSIIQEDFGIKRLDNIRAVAEQSAFWTEQQNDNLYNKAVRYMFELIMYAYILARKIKSKENRKRTIKELKLLYTQNYKVIRKSKLIKKSNKLFIKLSFGRLSGLKPLVWLRKLKTKR